MAQVQKKPAWLELLLIDQTKTMTKTMTKTIPDFDFSSVRRVRRRKRKGQMSPSHRKALAYIVHPLAG